VPAKEHLRFLEPQCLERDSRPLTALQTLFSCQVRLSCTHSLWSLTHQESQLLKLKNLPFEEKPTHVREFDTKRPARSNVNRIGTWIGNTLSYALFSQGPLCAALLMKVRVLLGSACCVGASVPVAATWLEHAERGIFRWLRGAPCPRECIWKGPAT
jgi:hypothetical protein